jgi:uncharacterized repeat protein (TIGR01451 family)
MGGGAGGVINDGVQNGTEAGINGVTVELYNSSNALIGTQLTASGGYYRFDNLQAGNYTVRIPFTPNFTVGKPLFKLYSSDPDEANPNVDIDRTDNGIGNIPNLVVGIQSGTVTLGPGNVEPVGETDLGPGGQGPNPDNRSNMTVDFGFIDEEVSKDRATRTPTFTPNPNVTPTRTNTPTVTPTPQPATSTSTPTPTPTFTPSRTPSSTLYGLGNRVWLDNGTGGGINNDGKQNGTEPGIGNVTVVLKNTSGTTLSTTVTDLFGYYRFDNLQPGQYQVCLLASNFTGTGSLVGLNSSTPDTTNPDTDVDRDDNGLGVTFNTSTGICANLVTIGPGGVEPVGETDLSSTGQGPAPDNQANMTVDFGFVGTLTTYGLGNRVWRDDGTGGGVNDNGRQDGTEPGIGNVIVVLKDASGTTTLDSKLTDSNGYYRFDNLPAGQYRVCVTVSNFGSGGALNGLRSSTPDETDPNSDGDRNDNGIGATLNPTVDVCSGTVTLGPGGVEPIGETDLGPGGQGPHVDNQANMTVDFGFVGTQLYGLGNRVWLDNGTGGGTNNDGIQNGTEPGIANVTVVLKNTSDVVLATTVTDLSGYYRFDNLPAAQYRVCVTAANFTGTGSLVGLNSSTPDATNPDTDVDRDDNGIGVTFNTSTGICSNLVTIGPGDVEPVGESDLSTTGQGPTADARANMTVDFGFVGTLTTYGLGNRVWNDNGTGGGIFDNGKQDGGELGIGNVTVVLKDSTKTVTLGTQTTDSSGYYRFDTLPPGDYHVCVVPANFVSGGPLNGYRSSTTDETDPNSNVDRNDNGIGAVVNPTTEVCSGRVTLGPGGVEPVGETDLSSSGQGPQPDNQANMTVDFGFVIPTTTISPTATPSVIVIDPAITKLGDPSLALPGETVVFRLTATNNGTAAATNVVVDDQLPNDFFTPISATTTKGTFTITGNEVKFFIGTLNPGETVIMTITTRVKDTAPTPASAVNVVTLTSDNGIIRTGTATVRITRGSLPATGEKPETQLPLIPLVIGGGLLIVAAGAFVMRRRKTA